MCRVVFKFCGESYTQPSPSGLHSCQSSCLAHVVQAWRRMRHPQQPCKALFQSLPTQTPTEGEPSGCEVDTVGLQLTAHGTERKCEKSEGRLPGFARIILGRGFGDF